MTFGDRDRAGVEVAGPCVIAEPGPLLEDGIERRRGEIGDRRPERNKAQVVVSYRRDGRLLQHDLAEPDAIGIGSDAAGALPRAHTPGQVPRMRGIPAQHRLRINGVLRDRTV
jgi:hypothetical protein